VSRSPLRSERQEHPSDRFRRAPVAMAAAMLAALGCGDVQAQAAAAPAAAASQATTGEAPALDAVTVHSRNRIERLQDVPLSVSVVQGAELDRMDAYSVGAIAKRAANVSWNIGNQRTSSISIRGVGKIGQTEAQDPSVNVIVDGVSYGYNALTSSFDFVDVETVEVARGPQGTLQGKNASVGSVTINTRRPSFTPTADYTLAFEQHNGVLGVAAIGGPVVDDLIAWRGTFSVDRQPGDKVNAYNRDITYTNTDRVSGRIQLLVTPSENFSARLAADLQPRAGETTNGRTINTPTPTQYADGAPNSLSTDSATRLSRRWFTQNQGYTLANWYGDIDNDNQRPLVTGSGGLASELNWKVPSGHTLTSITAYKTYHFDAVNDEGTPFDVYRNAGGFWNDYRQLSEELRVSSPAGGFVDYQGGVFLLKVNNSSEYRRAWGDDAGAWFASGSQYATLDADGAGRVLMVNSLANLATDYNSPTGLQKIENKSGAVFAQANWHFSDRFTLTTGARLTHENRTNVGSSSVTSNGSGAELNPVSVNGVALGGFPTKADGSLDTGGGPLSPAQQALADATAQKYFGVASYASLSAAQQAQVAAAKSIRAANIGVVFDRRPAQPWRGNLPAFTLSPSFRITPEVTSYFTYQHGEKAGIAQLVNGVSAPVEAEKTNAFELGVKSALLARTLILNADVFDMRISDYQQAVSVLDPYTTALANDGLPHYTAATGNVPRVNVAGLELDGVYGGIPRTTLRFSGAYNKAVYRRFPNSAQPVENADLAAGSAPRPYRDVSGMPLAGAPKYSFNVGADYHQPFAADKDAHVSANVAYSSSYYSDVALSQYSVIRPSVLADLAIGAGRRDKAFDVSLIVKNLFDNATPQARTWNTVTPAVPRSYGIQFTGKL
jgi:iron complex outermembrane receptor protein